MIKKFFNFRNINKQEWKLILIDSICLSLSLISFFLFSNFDLLWIGIIFSCFALLNIVFRGILKYKLKYEINKRVWLLKDLTLMLFVSSIYALVILITNSLIIEKSNYFVFIIIFIVYLIYILIYDLIYKKKK